MALAWVALIGFGALAGVGIVAILSVRRGERLVALIAAGTAFGFSGWGLTLVVADAARADVAVAAVALGIASAIAGYSLGSGLLGTLRVKSPEAPPLEPGPVTERVGVIVLADAEPAAYSPAAIATTLRIMEDADAPAVPVSLAPFFFAAQRARYAGAGGTSPARDSVRAVTQRLAAELDPERFCEPVTAFCEGDRSLSDALRELTGRGCRLVVVVSLAVAEGRPADLAFRELDALRPSDAGIRVIDAGVLWCADEIASLIAARALSACEGAEPTTGVVLVQHGQPPAWERDYPEFDSEELAFLNRVQALLVDAGLHTPNVRTAWAGWREPDVPEVIRHLAALGCARVLVCPACEPVECLDTLLDLPAAARMARVEVPTRVLPAWGTEPEVARALARAVEKALEE